MGAGILAVICLFSVSAVAQQHVKFSTARVNPKVLSSGGKAWVFGPQPVGSTQTAKDVAPTTLAPNLSFGNNVDASNPSEDVAGGQSETAIAAVGSRVMAAWNDASGFLVQPTTGRKASLTGVGFSSDSGRSFVDLVGLPNNNANEQWSGDRCAGPPEWPGRDAFTGSGVLSACVVSRVSPITRGSCCQAIEASSDSS